MPMIRIPEDRWGEVWRALVETGPISRFTQEPEYLVSARHVRMLRRKKLPFEMIEPTANGRLPNGRHG